MNNHTKEKTYHPEPVDTSSVALPNELQTLVESLAEHVHAIWAQQRIEHGWTWGPRRDDHNKHHPDLVPYDQLSEEEKQYDRQTAEETLKVVLQLGYRIEKKTD